MKRFIFIALTIIMVISSQAQKKYEANWESLDSRPLPSWFEDAKFGIFIHWGPYSVPAWSPQGTYEEWYLEWFKTKSIFGNGKFTGMEIPDFHAKTYGKDFSYFDFAKMFKAELYDPAEWADLFKKSGAKYVILTSKHHDGYTLWPNKHASDARFFPWNSAKIGAKRDLVGDYMKAMKGAGLKTGLYYSLYEWYHPWYRQRLKKFITDHYHPQFKELVNKYKPDLIYGDGQWEVGDDYWKSNELIQWLYNESPVKDDVVINDRWFKGSRHKHGGYYTTEYLREDIKFDKPWEEIRGMGLSFGYNRAENIEDYNSPKTLILMLADIIAQGGNFCLNVGPSADGKIPVIMQERLMQIGEWLNVNGEAVYGSRKWKKSWQWSKGDKKFNFLEGKAYKEGDYILKQTVDPIPGKAVKEIFFTQNDKAVFAIVPKWKKSIRVKDFGKQSVKSIHLLGYKRKLKWKRKGSDLIITMPQFDPNWTIPNYAYTLKITK